MKLKLDFKSISLGILIFLIGIVVLPLVVAFFMSSIIRIDDNYLRNFESIIEYLIWYISILLSGYSTALFSKNKNLRSPLIVSIIILIFSAIGTIADINDPKGDPFIQNLLGDLLIIPVALIGAKIGMKNKRTTH